MTNADREQGMTSDVITLESTNTDTVVPFERFIFFLVAMEVKFLQLVVSLTMELEGDTASTLPEVQEYPCSVSMLKFQPDVDKTMTSPPSKEMP